MTNNSDNYAHSPGKNSKPDLAGSAFWRSLTLLIKLFFQMITLIVLSRILPVEAFGKLAYAMVFIGFMSMAARFGVTPAIIQKPILSDVFLRAGFMLALSLGCITTLALYFSAPLFSSDLETIRLIQLISLIFICHGIGSVSEAQLLREFNFKAIFFVELIAFFFGYTCLSIAMALAGYGVWSLGAAAVATALIRALLMVVTKRNFIIPRWSTDEVRDLLTFGSGITLSALMYFFSQNLDYFIAGNLLGDESLAYYSRAKHMVSIPTQIISATAYTVLLSAFSRLNSDKAALKHLYLQAASVVALPTIAIAIVLILIAPEMIILLFGQQWTGSTVALQILAFNAFFILYTIGDALFVSQRKIRWQLISQTIFAVLVGLAALLGAQWGIVGIAIGVLIATGACFSYVALMSLHIVGASVSDFAESILPAIITATILIVAGLLLKHLLIQWGAPDWLVILSILFLTLGIIGGLVFSQLSIFSQHKRLLKDQLQKLSKLSPAKK